MDGRGRLAETVKQRRVSQRPMFWLVLRGVFLLTLEQLDAGRAALARALAGMRARRAAAQRPQARRREVTPFERMLRRWLGPMLVFRAPRGLGVAAAAAIVLGSVAYGVVRGGHVETVVTGFHDVRDALANAAGFRIVAVALSGNRQITREEILATAGVTGRSSLLFLDVNAARERLKANPWIADATVLKLFPDQLQVSIVERKPFALWQHEGRLSVIAQDGAVLEPYVARRFHRLPLVVGKGAAERAEGFLAMLDRLPAELREQVKASVFVAERRWNLRLSNGLDIRLPEVEPDRALEHLVELDRDKQLLSRDILTVDLRLADRVTVRLSDAAAQARLDAQKAKAKKKGNDA